MCCNCIAKTNSPTQVHISSYEYVFVSTQCSQSQPTHPDRGTSWCPTWGRSWGCVLGARWRERGPPRSSSSPACFCGWGGSPSALWAGSRPRKGRTWLRRSPPSVPVGVVVVVVLWVLVKGSAVVVVVVVAMWVLVKEMLMVTLTNWRATFPPNLRGYC